MKRTQRLKVLIRPLRPTDAAIVTDVFAGMSPDSRRQRFLMVKNTLTASDLAALTDVDHHHREAVVAIDPRTNRGIGVARFVRDPHDGYSAEAAVAIADDWQRRGIGTQLVQWLGERAEREGIRRFTALVSIENQPMIGLLRKFDADVEVVSIDGHIIEFDIALRGTRSSAQCA